jgi:hypothetical protein
MVHTSHPRRAGKYPLPLPCVTLRNRHAQGTHECVPRLKPHRGFASFLLSVSVVALVQSPKNPFHRPAERIPEFHPTAPLR